MDLIIDTNSIKDTTTKEWLLDTLKAMNISYRISERSQTVEEYNQEIAEAEEEIVRGEFTTAESLKKEAGRW